MRYCRRQKIYSSLLLLSVMVFSLSSAAHWLWHCPPGAHGGASGWRQQTPPSQSQLSWRTSSHIPLTYAQHRFDCPLCAGLLLEGDCPDGISFCPTAEVPAFFPALPSGHGIAALLVFSARGPPALV